MPIKTFQDIVAWKKSHELVLMVYKLTDKYPKQEIFGLTSQSRRCGVSIPSNIAEGFRRRTINDSLHFYNISQGSLEELRYQMILARDLGYIAKEEYGKFNLLAEEVSKVLNGWIKSQSRAD
jgi:four helix bundle protein